MIGKEKTTGEGGGATRIWKSKKGYPAPSYVIGKASTASQPCPISAVGELQHAAVGFSDLAAQDQTDAAAAVLGGEEWNKKIVAVEQAGALVADEDFNAARVGAPAHFHGAGMFERRDQARRRRRCGSG